MFYIWRAPLAGAEVDEGLGEEGAAANLQRSVGALVTAMRDLLGTIHLPNMGNNDEFDDDQSDDWTFTIFSSVH